MKTYQLLRRYIDKSSEFTIRSLAQKVGVSAPFLSRVLRGEKPLPETLFQKLVKELNVEPELFVPRARTAKVPESLSEWEIADDQADRILRSWFYLPILELTTLTDFDGTAESVARRLQIAQPTVDVALKELLSLGLLKKVDGKYQKVHARIRFTGSKSMELVRRFHAEMLEKSRRHLLEATSEEDRVSRLISGITVSATPEAVQAAKQALNDCLHKIANDLTAKPGSEVYQLALQFFPLSKK